MPTLNLKLTPDLNIQLNELVVKLTIANPLQGSNRSHAARTAIVELHDKLCKAELINAPNFNPVGIDYKDLELANPLKGVPR
jgi:hypothetical protein